MSKDTQLWTYAQLHLVSAPITNSLALELAMNKKPTPQDTKMSAVAQVFLLLNSLTKTLLYVARVLKVDYFLLLTNLQISGVP